MRLPRVSLFSCRPLLAFALVPLVLVQAAGALSAGASLLAPYEAHPEVFSRVEIGDKTIYYRARMIGEALVEKDCVVYQFDRATDTLVSKSVRWRDDLPQDLPELALTAEQAASKVSDRARSATLLYLSPESDVFPLSPTPRNPCWIVKTDEGGRVTLTVVDAIEGTLLGHGAPPPYDAFSFTGPWECPSSGGWDSWYLNARSWFNTMGYSTEGVKWATKAQIRGHVKSDTTAMFYEINHGGSSSFNHACDGSTWLSVAAWMVQGWIAQYAKMPFTFLASCDGMCSTGDGFFSHEFRKGSMENTTTVGYCGMSESYCEQCWYVSLDWQTALFNRMNQGWSVKAAFDAAMADYPVCAASACMRFVGDEDFAVVPVVRRDPEPPSVLVVAPDGGETISYGTEYEIRWVAADNARVVSITILLSRDGGASWPDTIAMGESNDSSCVWTVPDIDTRSARIRVIGLDGAANQGSDVSDGDFTLVGTTSGLEAVDAADHLERPVLRVVDDGSASWPVRIEYGLPASGRVQVGVYDVAGRLVARLADEYRPHGYHTTEWDAARVPRKVGPGVYFVRLDSSLGTATAKIMIAR